MIVVIFAGAVFRNLRTTKREPDAGDSAEFSPGSAVPWIVRRRVQAEHAANRWVEVQ
jgi:hypothetical protein